MPLVPQAGPVAEQGVGAGADPAAAVDNPLGTPAEPSPAETAAMLGMQIGQQAIEAHRMVDQELAQVAEQFNAAHQQIDMGAQQAIQQMQAAIVAGAQAGSGVASGPQAVGADAV